MSIYFPVKLLPDDTKINFVKHNKNIFVVILLFTLLSIVSIFTNGINFGIDFTGGTLIEIQTENRKKLDDIYKLADSIKIDDINIQEFDKNFVMMRIGSANADTNKISQFKNLLVNLYDNKIEFRKIEFVGPQVGKDLVSKCIIAVILSFVAIMIYVAIRFEWQFSLGIILALLHDAILTLGFMSVMQIDFDLTSIAAILTVIGYSVNDSVVIYDRIRENLKKYHKYSLSNIINMSLNETLSRTILTVATTLIAVLSLLVFGGQALHSFSVTVFVGIIIGTISSIYISAPIITYIGLKNKR
jgi:preprotein translocase subunit SecF